MHVVAGIPLHCRSKVQSQKVRERKIMKKEEMIYGKLIVTDVI